MITAKRVAAMLAEWRQTSRRAASPAMCNGDFIKRNPSDGGVICAAQDAGGGAGPQWQTRRQGREGCGSGGKRRSGAERDRPKADDAAEIVLRATRQWVIVSVAGI